MRLTASQTRLHTARTKVKTDNENKKVSYRKQTARQRSSSTVWKFSSRVVWSPCIIWLLILVCAHVGGPKILAEDGAGPLGRWAWLIRYPTCITTSNFVALCQAVCLGGVIIEIRQKFLTHRVPSFKVIQGQWNRHWSSLLPMNSY